MSNKAIFFEKLDGESKGYYGEKIFFDSIKEFFLDRECLAKHGYIMNFSGKKFTIEADVLLLDRKLGINIFEVKGIRIDNICSVSADGWVCENIYKDKINPSYQVDRNATNLIEFLKEFSIYNDGIGVKPIIVLPYITSMQWKNKKFDSYAFLPPIIFKDDLENKNMLLRKINDIPYKFKAKHLTTDLEFDEMKNILFGDIEKSENIYKVISEEEFLEQLLL